MHYFRGFYKTRWFILPVIGLSLTYNIPKFFELKLIFVDEDPEMFQNYFLNDTVKDLKNVTVDIAATEMRLNQHYIFVYIFICNSIVNLLIPFLLLIVLNLKTYKRIHEYEQRLSTFAQFKVIFRRNNSPQEGAEKVDSKDSNVPSSPDKIEIDTEIVRVDNEQVNNEELQKDLQDFFDEEMGEKTKNGERKCHRFFTTKRQNTETLGIGQVSHEHL